MELYKYSGKKFVVYQNIENDNYKIYEVSHSWIRYDCPTTCIVSSSDKEFMQDFNKEANTEWYLESPDIKGKVEVLRYTINHMYGDKDNCVFGFEVSEDNVFDTLEDAKRFKEECKNEKNSVRFFYYGLKDKPLRAEKGAKYNE